MYLRFRDFGYPVEVELVIVDNGRLILGYYSKVEGKRYLLESEINTTETLAIEMAPYGGVAILSADKFKIRLFQWLKAETLLNQNDELNAACTIPRDLFDNYMKQFTYRYVTMFGKWNGKGKLWEEYEEKDQLPEFGWIEEALFDGTHDKLRDGGLMKYHEAGKPKRLAVSWHIGKAEYSAYFWFEDEGIREVFDRLYGAHPDTKTDFIIRIDAERRKYELALYRYGLKAPQVIPEDVYQLLVFKNKFEDYRSDNYNQERGAWIW